MACRLYLISPERLDHPSIFADELRGAFDGGDVAAFQLRLKDVDEAQGMLVNLAKDLAAKGEIVLTKNRADDELVY